MSRIRVTASNGHSAWVYLPCEDPDAFHSGNHQPKGHVQADDTTQQLPADATEAERRAYNGLRASQRYVRQNLRWRQ